MSAHDQQCGDEMIHHDGDCEVLNLKEYDKCFCAARAAAPALLEALEFALARCEENGFPHGDLAIKARAAIAQARAER